MEGQVVVEIDLSEWGNRLQLVFLSSEGQGG